MTFRKMLILACMVWFGLVGIASALTITNYEGTIVENSHTHHTVGQIVNWELTDNDDDMIWDGLSMSAISNSKGPYTRTSTSVTYDSVNMLYTAYENTIRLWEFSVIPSAEFLFYDYDPNNDGMTFRAEVAPVPEPGTLLLLGSGLAGLAIYRRKKPVK